MIQLRCQPWNLSLTSVIVLALSNMLLTFLLLQSETCTQNSIGRELEINAATDWNLGTLLKEQQEECATRDYRHTTVDRLNLDVRLGRWDARRLFKTFDSIFVGSRFSELSQMYRVCLATQSSIEKLYSIVEVAHQWTGSMSVALYAAGDEEFEVLQKYLLYLKKCYEPVRERISFSLAVPRVKPLKKQPRTFALPDIVDCAKPEATLNELMSGISVEQTNWRTRNVYPQNHLRNLARKNCQSDYVFLTDVDIVPSLNLTSALDDFLRNENCDKCAYVIPTYELDSRVRFPSNKSDLVRLARKGLARPFHQKVFIHNQFATNFTRWVFDVSPTHKNYENIRNGKIYVSHEVTNFEFLYEPFYVAKDTAPAHDERFMGYGYTRNTQVYEMFVAGYQFKVLSPVFTVHWGLQTRKSRPSWRERQNNANRKYFDMFKTEVFARYLRDPLNMMKETE
ncbi:beta-1,4-glucuronyltransferase 1 [Vespula pensylvanica]|uniref:beta-1,4-glucuronyltransferase 1 n=1 Tax=Vespula pensylvanica TaxID=30213 RepID=UPI001CBA06EF|nr:beta-1,4-glucuronyltransferase 1 [Vespula pensylvanica]XP_043672951.1 beta-1,4-glucuronyltransferase 1 [Vespula pensylvanica]